MLDFILKYWLQELFGLIVIILSFVGKRVWKQWSEARKALIEKKEKEHEERIFEKLDTHFDGIDDRLNEIEGRFEEIDDRFNDLDVKLNILEQHDTQQDVAAEKRQKGILALFQKQFMSFGKELLNPNHVITYKEYVAYEKQHRVYNDLGGNHEGDEQFRLVKTKYEKGL